MKKSPRFWPLAYSAVTVFGGFAGHFLAVNDSGLHPGWFLGVSSALSFLYLGGTAYFSLCSKYEALGTEMMVSDAVWFLPPTNAQANRFGQALFFSSIGISAILGRLADVNHSIGFVPLAMGIGTAVALIFFRFRYRVA